MPNPKSAPPLAWLQPGDAFPPLTAAWGKDSPAPGLLAAGSHLDWSLLLEAYRHGVFPWFSPGQPVLWWSPDPRMVLDPQAFRVRRSLRQSLRQWQALEDMELVFDHDFAQVMARCASQPRKGQNGSWIVPEMIRAYTDLHDRGWAHSAELRLKGQLVAGLYFVALGQALYGESMFTTVRDGSKLALCLLVSVARRHGIRMIDCQQNTGHLASLGATEIPRPHFVAHMHQAQARADIDWRRESLYWNQIFPDQP